MLEHHAIPTPKNISHIIIEDPEARVAGAGNALAGDAIGRGRQELGAFDMRAEAAGASDRQGPTDDEGSPHSF